MVNCIGIGGNTSFIKGIVAKNFFSYSALELTSSRAINCDSIVNSAMIIYLVDFHDNAPTSKVTTYLLVNFISFDAEIEFASHCSSNIEGIYNT